MSEQLIEYISTLVVNYSDHTEGVNVATSLASWNKKMHN